MITQLVKADANSLARIHKTALKNDFLPSLGENFLTTFYKSLIGEKGIFAFAERNQNQILGFVIGTDDMGLLFKKVLRSNFLELSLSLLLALLKNPGLIIRVAESFLYPTKESGPKAELVVIVVLKKFQGKGIGKKLVKVLEKAFKENKIKEYKLTVHADKKAVNFYEKLKYQRLGDFKLYGKSWLIYSKSV